MKYYIWSYRHSQWWGPDNSGYTLHLEKAGQYDRADAAQIVLSGLPGGSVAVDVSLTDRIPARAIEVEKYLDTLRRI
jgi:hypothetical protein